MNKSLRTLINLVLILFIVIYVYMPYSRIQEIKACNDFFSEVGNFFNKLPVDGNRYANNEVLNKIIKKALEHAENATSLKLQDNPSTSEVIEFYINAQYNSLVVDFGLIALAIIILYFVNKNHWDSFVLFVVNILK